MADMTKDDNASPATIRASMRSLIAERLKTFLATEAAYRRQDDDDPEIVHDARVAARRLRAGLDTAGATARASWLKDLRRAVKRAGRALGAVRDADVQLAPLETERDSGRAREVPGIDRLVARLGRERAAANQRALATLGDPRIRAALAEAKRRLKDDGDPSARRLDKGRRSRGGGGTQQIAEELDALLASAETSQRASTPEAMHEQRIAAKRLRYTIELHLPDLGEPGNEAVETLRGIQDTLGALHDLDVLLDLTRDELRVVADEESALALGGKAVPARNAERGALLAFLARVAKERAERAAAFQVQWGALVAGGLADRLRTLATGSEGRGSPDA